MDMATKEIAAKIVGSKYYTHVLPRLEEIYQMLCDGYTEYSIADNLGIGHNTLIEYKKRFPEIIEVFTRARTQKNALVMHSMFKKSNGIVQKIPQQKVTKDGDVIDFTETIYIPPDVNAADLYLRNNDPDYKGAKDVGSLTLIQNNYQLSDAKAEIAKLLQEYNNLQSIEAVDVQPIEEE